MSSTNPLKRLERSSVIQILIYMKDNKAVNRTEGEDLNWVSRPSWTRGLDTLEILDLVTIEHVGREIQYTLNNRGKRISELLAQVEDVLKE